MPINYEVKNEIGIFTIDNGKVNAITHEMHEELYLHLKDFLSDDSVKVAILSGSKGKCFSAGDDLNEGDGCLLYTSPSPRDRTRSRMPSSA